MVVGWAPNGCCWLVGLTRGVVADAIVIWEFSEGLRSLNVNSQKGKMRSRYHISGSRSVPGICKHVIPRINYEHAENKWHPHLDKNITCSNNSINLFVFFFSFFGKKTYFASLQSQVIPTRLYANGVKT